MVTILPGWFSESLKDWSEPVALAWLDVDLASSTRDVLTHVGDCLEPGGALFCHEFKPEFLSGDRVVADSGPAGALREYLEAHQIDYSARFIAGWLGMACFDASVAPWSPALLDALLPGLRDLDHRARAARSVHDSWRRRIAVRMNRLFRAR